MRRLWFACLLVCAGQVSADATPAEATAAVLPPSLAVPLVSRVPSGYAFEQPELLVAQHLWGIVHGVRLLAQACARRGHAAAAESWVDWQEREATAIRALNARLGEHYFGRAEAAPDVLAVVLGLRQSLDLAPAALDVACDTLGAALAQPRYDLQHRREELLARHREELSKP